MEFAGAVDPSEDFAWNSLGSCAINQYGQRSPPLRGRNSLGDPIEPFASEHYSPRRLAWIWHDPDMMAEYWDFDLDGVFTKALADPAGLNMTRQGGRQVSTTFFGSPFSTDPYDDLDNLDRKGRHEQALAERRDRYVEDARRRELSARMQVVCFRDPGGGTRAEIPWMLPYDEVGYRELEGENFRLGSLRESLVILSGSAVASQESRTLHFSEPPPQAKERGHYTALPARVLEPGEYWAVLRLADPVGGASALLRAPFTAPDFSGKGVALSDLCFSSAITETTAPGRFAHGDWRVEPLPSRRYRRGEALQVYFEIYGLGTDAEGGNHYRVSSWIIPDESGGRASAAWASVGQEQRERGEMARFPMIVGTRGMTPGRYRIEIEVEDRIAGLRARREGTFVLE